MLQESETNKLLGKAGVFKVNKLVAAIFKSSLSQWIAIFMYILSLINLLTFQKWKENRFFVSQQIAKHTYIPPTKYHRIRQFMFSVDLSGTWIWSATMVKTHTTNSYRSNLP